MEEIKEDENLTQAANNQITNKPNLQTETKTNSATEDQKLKSIGIDPSLKTSDPVSYGRGLDQKLAEQKNLLQANKVDNHTTSNNSSLAERLAQNGNTSAAAKAAGIRSGSDTISNDSQRLSQINNISDIQARAQALRTFGRESEANKLIEGHLLGNSLDKDTGKIEKQFATDMDKAYQQQQQQAAQLETETQRQKDLATRQESSQARLEKLTQEQDRANKHRGRVSIEMTQSNRERTRTIGELEKASEILNKQFNEQNIHLKQLKAAKDKLDTRISESEKLADKGDIKGAQAVLEGNSTSAQESINVRLEIKKEEGYKPDPNKSLEQIAAQEYRTALTQLVENTQKSLQSSTQTNSDGLRQLDQLQQLQKHLTELEDAGKYQEILDLKDGKKSFETTVEYGSETMKGRVLNQELSLTKEESQRDFERLLNLSQEARSDLSTASSGMKSNAETSKEDADKYSSIGFSRHVRNQNLDDAEIENRHGNKIERVSGELARKEAEARELASQGKLDEARTLLKDTLTWASTEQRDTTKILNDHYNQTKDIALRNIQGDFDAIKSAGVMVAAATVTIATAGTAAPLAVGLMATAAGTASGMISDTLDSAADGKSLQETVEYVKDRTGEHARTAVVTSASAGTGLWAGAATKSALAAGAASAVPGVADDAVSFASDRASLIDQLEKTGKSETEINAELKKQGLDFESLGKRTLASLAVSTLSGQIGKSLQIDNASKLVQNGLKLAETTTDITGGVAETFLGGMDINDPNFVRQAVQGVVQTGIASSVGATTNPKAPATPDLTTKTEFNSAETRTERIAHSETKPNQDQAEIIASEFKRTEQYFQYVQQRLSPESNSYTTQRYERQMKDAQSSSNPDRTMARLKATQVDLTEQLLAHQRGTQHPPTELFLRDPNKSLLGFSNPQAGTQGVAYDPKHPDLNVIPTASHEFLHFQNASYRHGLIKADPDLYVQGLKESIVKQIDSPLSPFTDYTNGQIKLDSQGYQDLAAATQRVLASANPYLRSNGALEIDSSAIKQSIAKEAKTLALKYNNDYAQSQTLSSKIYQQTIGRVAKIDPLTPINSPEAFSQQIEEYIKDFRNLHLSNLNSKFTLDRPLKAGEQNAAYDSLVNQRILDVNTQAAHHNAKQTPYYLLAHEESQARINEAVSAIKESIAINPELKTAIAGDNRPDTVRTTTDLIDHPEYLAKLQSMPEGKAVIEALALIKFERLQQQAVELVDAHQLTSDIDTKAMLKQEINQLTNEMEKVSSLLAIDGFAYEPKNALAALKNFDTSDRPVLPYRMIGTEAASLSSIANPASTFLDRTKELDQQRISLSQEVASALAAAQSDRANAGRYHQEASAKLSEAQSLQETVNARHQVSRILEARDIADKDKPELLQRFIQSNPGDDAMQAAVDAGLQELKSRHSDTDTLIHTEGLTKAANAKVESLIDSIKNLSVSNRTEIQRITSELEALRLDDLSPEQKAQFDELWQQFKDSDTDNYRFISELEYLSKEHELNAAGPKQFEIERILDRLYSQDTSKIEKIFESDLRPRIEQQLSKINDLLELGDVDNLRVELSRLERFAIEKSALSIYLNDFELTNTERNLKAQSIQKTISDLDNYEQNKTSIQNYLDDLARTSSEREILGDIASVLDGDYADEPSLESDVLQEAKSKILTETIQPLTNGAATNKALTSILGLDSDPRPSLNEFRDNFGLLSKLGSLARDPQPHNLHVLAKQLIQSDPREFTAKMADPQFRKALQIALDIKDPAVKSQRLEFLSKSQLTISLTDKILGPNQTAFQAKELAKKIETINEYADRHGISPIAIRNHIEATLDHNPQLSSGIKEQIQSLYDTATSKDRSKGDPVSLFKGTVNELTSNHTLATLGTGSITSISSRDIGLNGSVIGPNGELVKLKSMAEANPGDYFQDQGNLYYRDPEGKAVKIFIPNEAGRINSGNSSGSLNMIGREKLLVETEDYKGNRSIKNREIDTIYSGALKSSDGKSIEGIFVIEHKSQPVTLKNKEQDTFGAQLKSHQQIAQYISQQSPNTPVHQAIMFHEIPYGSKTYLSQIKDQYPDIVFIDPQGKILDIPRSKQ